MDPGALVVLLVCVGAVVLWIIAGVKSYRLAHNSSLVRYFVNLFASFAGIFILWLIIVYPTLDCEGMLCGLAEAVIWFFSSLLLFLVWPIVLILYFNKKYANKRKKRSSRKDDILDTDI